MTAGAPSNVSDNAIKFSPSAGIGMPGEIDVYAVKVNEMRFVILSQPRTGSSLLVSSLRAHPQVCCRDEVINSHQADWFKDLPWPGADRLMTCLAGQDGQAIGCKMHACDPDPDHRSPSEWESAWDALSEDQEVRVICLYRQNVIAQLASWKVAEALHEWGVQSSGARPKIQISPNE